MNSGQDRLQHSFNAPTAPVQLVQNRLMARSGRSLSLYPGSPWKPEYLRHRGGVLFTLNWFRALMPSLTSHGKSGAKLASLAVVWQAKLQEFARRLPQGSLPSRNRHNGQSQSGQHR